jgi:hypothetical protein
LINFSKSSRLASRYGVRRDCWLILRPVPGRLYSPRGSAPRWMLPSAEVGAIYSSVSVTGSTQNLTKFSLQSQDTVKTRYFALVAEWRNLAASYGEQARCESLGWIRECGDGEISRHELRAPQNLYRRCRLLIDIGPTDMQFGTRKRLIMSSPVRICRGQKISGKCMLIRDSQGISSLRGSGEGQVGRCCKRLGLAPCKARQGSCC